jgi:hypothetical protein
LLKFQLRPTPVQAIFVAHPQVALNCSVVAAVAGVGSALQPITGDMLGGATSGDFENDVPSFQFDAKIPTSVITIAGRTLVMTPKVADEAVILLAK